MGKSTTAGMFAEAGVPVHDSDDAVHRLYSGTAAPLIEARFPGVVVDGTVDRNRLAAAVLGDPQALREVEKIVHPLVRKDADAFLEKHRRANAPLVVLDIPLLFETGGEGRVDRIVVVTAPAKVQRQRVMSRPGMTEDKFLSILARQVPDAEKRARADYVIDTSLGMEAARQRVRAIVAELAGGKPAKPAA
jgi:dephospho-CoA kinase